MLIEVLSTKVPVLLGPDDLKLTDSLEITLFLASRYPQLLPDALQGTITAMLDKLHQVWFEPFVHRPGRSRSRHHSADSGYSRTTYNFGRLQSRFAKEVTVVSPSFSMLEFQRWRPSTPNF